MMLFILMMLNIGLCLLILDNWRFLDCVSAML
jgi:hypothetical protein